MTLTKVASGLVVRHGYWAPDRTDICGIVIFFQNLTYISVVIYFIVKKEI
jgi:hypothetical protein